MLLLRATMSRWAGVQRLESNKVYLMGLPSMRRPCLVVLSLYLENECSHSVPPCLIGQACRCWRVAKSISWREVGWLLFFGG